LLVQFANAGRRILFRNDVLDRLVVHTANWRRDVADRGLREPFFLFCRDQLPNHRPPDLSKLNRTKRRVDVVFKRALIFLVRARFDRSLRYILKPPVAVFLETASLDRLLGLLAAQDFGESVLRRFFSRLGFPVAPAPLSRANRQPICRGAS